MLRCRGRLLSLVPRNEVFHCGRFRDRLVVIIMKATSVMVFSRVVASVCDGRFEDRLVVTPLIE